MTEYDPLETFARLYYERHGYFVRTNVFFGSDEIDVIAMTPNKDEIIACFCITTTMKVKINDFGQEYMTSIKKSISKKYDVPTKHIKFHYFTLWLGGRQSTIDERVRMLNKIGFSKVIGPPEIHTLVDSIVENYRNQWEVKGREGPKEIEPILWTIKTLWRIGYFER